MSNNYRPQPGTGQYVTTAEYRAELMRLKQAQERASPSLTWALLSEEPEKIVANMEVLADGTNWDPASIGVPAKYRRNPGNTAWDLIEATVVAAGLAAHLADTSDAHDASAISNVPAGTIAATDVQAAVNELDGDIQAHIADATAAHAASAISFTPVGTIAATDAQTAIAEVATDAATALSNHEAAADPHPGYLTPAEGNAAYQPLDADLTSWAGVTRAAGYDTFATTPNSANLRNLVTDETGTGGALVFANGPSLTDPAIFGASILGKANTDLAGFDLRFEYNSATASANRSVTWDLNNASRTFNLFGNLVVSAAADVSGTNTGDEDLGSLSTVLAGATAKNPPVDADVAIILDSADSNAIKRVTWANYKATLKTYFDTLYQSLAAALTSWAGVTRAAGFDTFAATPSSANLRTLLTDESGTGAAYFQGGDLGTPSAGVLTNATGTASGLTAGIASTVSIANEAADTTCFPLFGTAASGDLQPKTNANITFNASTGVFTSASLVATTADINGGTVDNATIGATTASTGKFTTVETTGSAGIGTAINSTIGLYHKAQITGATNAYGTFSQNQIQSGVTGNARVFATEPSTVASAFTVASLIHYDATQGTIGATSAVTAQRGYNVANSLTGATTNYGFYGGLDVSGTARYNIYMAGTALNYLRGLTTFGAKFGYGTLAGIGGTVTQATNKSTGVTLNTVTGEITMNGAALAAATIVSFTMTNSTIEAADVLILNHVTTGTRGAYTLNAQCAAGSAIIYVRNNTAGSLSEAIVIRFAAVRGATA